MKRLPREMAIDLKNYVLDIEIMGLNEWDVMKSALPDDEDSHEFIIQCIFNELDLDGRPSTFSVIDETGRFIFTGKEFAKVIDFAINGSEDFDMYEYRDGRVFDLYDDMFVDEN